MLSALPSRNLDSDFNSEKIPRLRPSDTVCLPSTYLSRLLAHSHSGIRAKADKNLLTKPITMQALRSSTARCVSKTLKPTARAFASASKTPIVNSHNEWDPLEEVIVGRVDGATIPEWHVSGKAVWPNKWWDMYKTKSGQPFPKELMEGAAKELDYLAEVLEGEGVIVRRPEASDNYFNQSVETPDFKAKSQLYAAMPRDVLIVFGNEVLEAPMAWRSRYFEYRPYRKLIKEYFQVGALHGLCTGGVTILVLTMLDFVANHAIATCRKEPSGPPHPSLS